MNLLEQPLFRVRTRMGLEQMSLPQVMAALGSNDIKGFVGLQRHQSDPFHVFLCYLGATILARTNATDPVQSSTYWHNGLLHLAGNAGSDAWELVNEDLSRPAFMQPPLPKDDHARLKPLKPLSYTVDTLDLLPTAKNHDVKRARAAEASPDEWIYSLISVQTMSGYFGSGNRGISRMNGGYGNRSIVELVRTLSPSQRWRDAVVRLLSHRTELLAAPYGYAANGLVLVWLETWNGKESLPLTQLDPFYIEICRRIRLSKQGALHALGVGSNVNRIDSKDLRGVMGDPWLPVDLSGPADKALTMPAHGVTPDMLRRLIFGDELQLSILQRPMATWEGQVWISLSVLIRGEGTTEGFHEHVIPIPGSVNRRLFGRREQAEPLASLSKNAIEFANIMLRSVLRPAIFAYIEGDPQRIQFDRDSAQAWWTRCARQFERLWADDYFPWLWSVPEAFDDEVLLKDWALILRDHALQVLRAAQETLPHRQGRKYRSWVGAERVFWGSLYSDKNFPMLKEGSS